MKSSEQNKICEKFYNDQKKEYLKLYRKIIKSFSIVIDGKLTQEQEEINEILEPLLEDLEELILKKYKQN